MLCRAIDFMKNSISTCDYELETNLPVCVFIIETIGNFVSEHFHIRNDKFSGV